MAPPPPPSKCSPVELPCASVMFWVSLGFAWSWQCDVVHICRLSHVSMYRIRRMPAPLSVTFPPPSIITLELVLRTLAVARMTMVTGEGPQRKVTPPPLATARTAAAEVQLAALPLPMANNHPASEYHPYWPPRSGAQGGGRVTTVVRREEGRDLCPQRQLRASL